MIQSTAWPDSWREYQSQFGYVSPTPFVRTYDNLAWHYGHDRASNIVDGVDVPTNADMEKWRSLGLYPHQRARR